MTCVRQVTPRHSESGGLLWVNPGFAGGPSPGLSRRSTGAEGGGGHGAWVRGAVERGSKLVPRNRAGRVEKKHCIASNNHREELREASWVGWRTGIRRHAGHLPPPNGRAAGGTRARVLPHTCIPVHTTYARGIRRTSLHTHTHTHTPCCDSSGRHGPGVLAWPRRIWRCRAHKQPSFHVVHACQRR